MIKIKISKFQEDENEHEKSNYKIIFDFDKNKFKESTIENDFTYEKKEPSVINEYKIEDSGKIRESNEHENFHDKSKISVIIPKTSINKKILRRSNKSYSIKSNENKLKKNLKDIFDLEEKDPEEKKDKFEEIKKYEDNKFIINKFDDRIEKVKKIPIKNRTKSMQNRKDLVSDSNGFRRLSKAIPSLINTFNEIKIA